MAVIELIVRVPFYVVTLFLLVYSRAAISSSVIMVVAAWLAFGHPEANSPGQEVVAFFLSWLLALVSAVLMRGWRNPQWLIALEQKLVVASLRKTIDAREVGTYFLAALVATLAYVATEVLGYQHDVFFRIQSLVWLLLLGFVIAIYDAVVSDSGFRLLPRTARRLHIVVMAFIAAAVQIDILVREPSFWKFLLPYDLVLLGLTGVNFVYYLANTSDRTKTQ